MNATRQAVSPRLGASKLPKMPLMPAMRPVPSHNSAAERPMRTPPIMADTGVKCSIRSFLSRRDLATRTEQPIELGKNRAHSLRADAIKNDGAVTPSCDQTFLAQHCEVAGEVRLSEAEKLHEIADGPL